VETVSAAIRDKDPGYRRLRILFWCAAVALGAASTWPYRYSMNPDGVPYLDMGDAYLRGDWHMALSTCWSPLYSWLLGLSLKVLEPSAHWEFPLVHLVNLAIYLAALLSFEFFLRAFIGCNNGPRKSTRKEGGAALPEWVWWTLGYSLFIWRPCF